MVHPDFAWKVGYQRKLNISMSIMRKNRFFLSRYPSLAAVPATHHPPSLIPVIIYDQIELVDRYTSNEKD